MNDTAPGQKEKKTPTWVKLDREGLYLHAPSGAYYARYRLNGKQRIKALGTQVLTAARIKHREFMAGIEKARATKRPDCEIETMGDCDRLLRSQLVDSLQSPRTKKNYCDQLDAVAKWWPSGSYDKTRPATVTHDVLVQLRTALLQAPWKVHNTRKSKHGYSNAYVNQCLSRLGNVLEIARLKGLCTSDPFAQVTGLQGPVLLPVHSRKPDLPSKSDMDRMFAEMARVVPGPTEDPAFTKWRQDRAIEASEHARFMAYSGMRQQEANRMTWEDVKADQLRVHGIVTATDGRTKRQTKSDAGDRFVPIFPAMRSLLNEIRSRRPSTTGRILVPHTSLNAIKAACKRLGLKRLKQHDLRHYFATKCLESTPDSPGVDIPTLSRWLGHKDGGALCQRVYGHLRQEHSLAAAARVTL